MAETIKYNAKTLRARATDIRAQVSSYADAMDKLSNLVNDLPNHWAGTAERKYVSSFQQLIAGFDGMVAVLESYATALDKAADNMETTDKKHAKKLKSV